MFVLLGPEAFRVKKVAPFLPMLLLAACAPDARDIALADVDLGNMEVVREIRRQLPAEDRPVFGTYVVRHAVSSPSFCGEVLVDSGGREPRTIGEAIALTVMREEELRRERLAAKRPPTAAEALRREREGLIAQKEALIGRRTYLYSLHGPAAEQLPEWRKMAEQEAEYDAELRALEPGPDEI